MKHVSILLMSAAALCACHSDDAMESMPDAAEAGPQWTSLFDGATFEHWKGYGQDTMPAGWVVDDGAMFASEPGQGMDLISRAPFTSFEFEFDWKVKEAGNSGVMWHVDESAGSYPWMTGPEYQLLDDGAHNDGAVSKNSAASNYDVYTPSKAMTNPAGEWNEARIVVDGAHVEHWLNGEMVVTYEKGSDDWTTRVAGSKWATMESYGSTSTGHLAIQGDHGAVWFRNLRIRELN
ncbi:MAG: hypothetical protein ACI835_000615 [Planctomycetota bacterium]|jgi:hypothetical protein